MSANETRPQLFVVRVRDMSGKWVGNFAGLSEGEPTVNRSLLCSCKYREEESANEVAIALNKWGKDYYVFSAEKLREVAS